MLYDFLASNYPISMVILGLVGAWAYRSRSSIRLATMEDSPIWKLIARIGVASTTLMFVWITLLDNWRQLLGYLVITGRDYASDPFERSATPEMLRAVTLALLAVSLISLALIYARHMGPYVALVVTLVLAPIYLFTFNEVRISADAFLRLSEMSLQNPSLLDAVSIVFWSTGMFVIIGTVAIAAYLTALAILALPLRIVYGLLAAPKQENLARIFESYERRAKNSRSQQSRESSDSGLNHDAPVNG